jgi:HEAT repeat protein
MRSQQMTPTRSRVTSAIVLFAFVASGTAMASLVAQSSQAPARAETPARPASLDEILKEVSSYNGGIESSALWKLRDYVYARKDDAAGRAECEAKLLAFLKTPATPVAKMAACRHLRVIAGDTAVPALQSLLADSASADLALYVLQQIPGAAAGKALLQALTTAVGPTKTAVIAALGQRANADAVPALAPLLKQPAFAAQALGDAYASASADLKPAVAAALMKCAEKSLADPQHHRAPRPVRTRSRLLSRRRHRHKRPTRDRAARAASVSR